MMTGLPKSATNPFSSTDWPPPELLRLLRQLPHLTGRRKPYHHGGRRTAGLQTSGIEMADFRRYSQGEDYRLIDQFALARLDQLVIRLFHDRKSLPVCIFLDTSQSMFFGQPDKFSTARNMALLTGAAALLNQDRLWMMCLNAAGALLKMSFDRPQSIGTLINFLRMCGPHSGSHPPGLLRRLIAAGPRQGLLIMISDLLPAADMLEVFSISAALHRQLSVLQVLSPQELSPADSPAAELVEPETGQRRRISNDPSAKTVYAGNLARWLNQIESASQKCGADWSLISTADPLQSLFRGGNSGPWNENTGRSRTTNRKNF